eukprot:584417-Pleurochrysis_carterae.AAC.1
MHSGAKVQPSLVHSSHTRGCEAGSVSTASARVGRVECDADGPSESVAKSCARLEQPRLDVREVSRHVDALQLGSGLGGVEVGGCLHTAPCGDGASARENARA